MTDYTQRAITRSQLASNERPMLQISWWKSADGTHYVGLLQIWLDDSTRGCGAHYVTVSESTPIGRVTAIFDGFSCGCWSMTEIEAAEVTLRDLQWVTCWAAESLKRLHSAANIKLTQCCAPRSLKALPKELWPQACLNGWKE